VAWLGRALQGDLGDSYRLRQDVPDLIGDRLPLTLQLIGLAILIAIAVAILLGVIQAHRRNSALDYGAALRPRRPELAGLLHRDRRGAGVRGLAGLAAGLGSGQDPDQLRHLILPAVASLLERSP
jgi:peptide/nickel transport system permease protein